MPSYASLYTHFDSPVMRVVRAEAYGDDIGQHSWVTVDELRRDAALLGLNPNRTLLDLGCGPGGPLSWLVKSTGCRGIGVDFPSSLPVAEQRAASQGVAGRCTFIGADLDIGLPANLAPLDAVIAIDMVLHLRDRESLWAQLRGHVRPRGRMLFTDAAVLTGALSDEELQRRSAYGALTVVPPGWNEARLEASGWRLIESEDRTESVVNGARGRLGALRRHEHELRVLIGSDDFDGQVDYLHAVDALASRRALSRFMYLAEAP